VFNQLCVKKTLEVIVDASLHICLFEKQTRNKRLEKIPDSLEVNLMVQFQEVEAMAICRLWVLYVLVRRNSRTFEETNS